MGNCISRYSLVQKCSPCPPCTPYSPCPPSSPSLHRSPSPPSSPRPPSPPSSYRSHYTHSSPYPHSSPSSAFQHSTPCSLRPDNTHSSRNRKYLLCGITNSPEPVLPLAHRLSLKCNGDVNTCHSTDISDGGWITGGVMLDNDILSVVDYINYSVKIIDVNNNKVISCIILPTRPWDITRVEREQVVVTCYDRLVFIKVGETLSVVKEVNTSDDCLGIVYTNNTLIVSFLHPGLLKVLDVEGHILKIISTDDKGQNMFEEPCSIALSPDQKTLYVSDEGNHSVTRMDLNGTVQHVYKRDTMSFPRSLAVDLEGNIYVMGRGPYIIHIIAPQGTIKRLIHEEISEVMMNKPFAIIRCKKDKLFYISHFIRYNNPVNIVTAYQIG